MASCGFWTDESGPNNSNEAKVSHRCVKRAWDSSLSCSPPFGRFSGFGFHSLKIVLCAFLCGCLATLRAAEVFRRSFSKYLGRNLRDSHQIYMGWKKNKILLIFFQDLLIKITYFLLKNKTSSLIGLNKTHFYLIILLIIHY